MTKNEYIEFMSAFNRVDDTVIRFEQKDIDNLMAKLKGRIPEGLDFKFFLMEAPTIQYEGKEVYASSRFYGRHATSYSLMIDEMVNEYIGDFRLRGITHYFDKYHIGLMTYVPGRKFVRYSKIVPNVTVCSII